MTTVTQALQAKAIQLGKLALEATTAAGSGHPTTALSLAHLTAVLMYRAMRWDPATSEHRGADRLVLSEGHAVPIVYAACADLGVAIMPGGKRRAMTREDLMALRSIDSVIDGHPNPMLGFPFFDAATGSLGQGLSVAAGLGAAARLDGIDKTIFCVIGDGEAREGQIWEAMDFIAENKLANVVAIFNCNMLGQSDPVAPAEEWQALQRKAEAFGWLAIALDGHDPAAIESALKLRETSDRPLCLLARTVKGWGVPFLTGEGHHGTAVPSDKLDAALAALDERARQLAIAELPKADITAALPITAPPAVSAPVGRSEPIGFQGTMAADAKLAAAFEGRSKMSPRRAYGLALKALGGAWPDVVALDADVKNSTYAIDFAKAYPDRFFEAHIAEQNMVSVAAGLWAGGKLPFVSTFGRFLERATDEIEMAIIGGANLKLVGTHVGVTLAADGPSQMALAEIAFMRALSRVTDMRGNPAITVLTPSDAASAYAMVLAMANADSACYLRAVRGDLPLLYDADEAFPFEGHKVLREGGDNCAVILVSSGYMVHSCLAAAGKLAERGIDCKVVDAYALPLDCGPILALARAGGAILAVEDNYVGGIGSELAEAAAATRDPPLVRSLAVHRIPKSGRTADNVLAYVGLAIDDIVAAVQQISEKRRT